MWEFLMHKSLSFFFRIPSLFTDMWSPPLIFYFIRRICNFLGWFLLSAFFLVLSGAFLFSPDEFYSPRRICSPWITYFARMQKWPNSDPLKIVPRTVSSRLIGSSRTTLSTHHTVVVKTDDEKYLLSLINLETDLISI